MGVFIYLTAAVLAIATVYFYPLLIAQPRLAQNLVFGREGTGNGEFQLARGVVFRDDTHVFIADSGNNRVQELRVTTNVAFVRSLTADGAMRTPQHVSIARDGELLIVSEFPRSTPRILDAQSGNQSARAPAKGLSVRTSRPFIRGTAFDEETQRLFVAETEGGVSVWHNGTRQFDFRQVGASEWEEAYGIALGYHYSTSNQGRRLLLYVADGPQNRVRVFDVESRQHVCTIGGRRDAPQDSKSIGDLFVYSLRLPQHVAVHPKSGDIYISDTGFSRVSGWSIRRIYLDAEDQSSRKREEKEERMRDEEEEEEEEVEENYMRCEFENTKVIHMGPGNQQPYGIAFNPAGDLLAVAFDDHVQVLPFE